MQAFQPQFSVERSIYDRVEIRFTHEARYQLWPAK
jgi:hypothetical protein